MLCPSCHRPLSPPPPDGCETPLVCPDGHRFHEADGVLRLLDAAFARRLDAFCARLSAIRAAEGRRLLNPALYPQLPDAPALRGDHEWRARRYDLELVRGLLRGRGPQTVLDVGAWNGWLCNRLALLGHTVTGVDYFIDAYDGLGARKFYRSAWRAIQLDLRDLDVLGEQFGLVVLNRCLAFAGDPAAFVAAARRRVAPGGLLVLTGIELYRDPRARASYVAALRRRYRERYDFELFLAPTRGYLDHGDRATLRALGLTLRPYPQLWGAQLKALLRPTRPGHYYGLWRRGR